MGVAGLHRAISRGEPLTDVSVTFHEGVDGELATKQINSLADVFDLYPKPWYDDPRSRIGSATREALERMFGWCLRRVLVPNRTTDFWWEVITPPTRYPAGLENLIETMGLAQPGADDDGQWYEYP
jgi:hypothetical protein